MYTIAVLVGSLRKESINKRLFKALATMSNDILFFKEIVLDDIPLFNQDIEGSPPQSVVALRETIKTADGVLFITPEYNRSLPAVLKNAVDWASRPYGKHCLSQKPAATAGVSGSGIGTACAQQELRRILLTLSMKVMGQPEMYIGGNAELIDANGNVMNEGSAKFFRSFLEAFHAWIEKVK